MTDRIPLDHLTSDQLDALYDQLDTARAEAAQARAEAAVLGARVVGWADLAKSHQHWGQRRWNAWKNARTRAQRLRAELDQYEEDVVGDLNERNIDLARQAARAEKELAALRARLADYEHRITWHTTCGTCAHLLDTSIRDTDRADQATAERDQLAGILREILAAFSTVVRTEPGGPAIGYLAEHPIHPDDMTRWQASVDTLAGLPAHLADLTDTDTLEAQ